jgi:hypothetical protein
MCWTSLSLRLCCISVISWLQCVEPCQEAIQKHPDYRSVYDPQRHHACRYIGVTKVNLYVADGEPKPKTAELRSYSKKFLQWRTLSEQRPEESESQFVRRKCMEENQRAYAYITFLHTYDYIMPRGEYKNKYGELRNILKRNEFRFAPGVPST